MRRNLLFFIFFAFIAFSNVYGQTHEVKEMRSNCSHGCRAGVYKGHLYIPPPQAFFDMQMKRGEPKCDIIVTYIGYPNDAREAFEYAVSIWESIISSPVPIRITANWAALDDGVLGSCSPYSYYSNFAGALKPNVLYPVALAEKLHGDHLNFHENPDIVANFSSSVPWYKKTDGNTPSSQFDLVTVVLHEIGHGLGFTGGAYGDKDASLGYWDDGFPYYFDTFIQNAQKENVRNTNLYPNASTELYNQLVSRTLNFSSPVVLAQNNSSPAKLFAPDPYDGGSSVYHLDEYTYDASESSLMTPWVDYAQAIHDPGVITSAIFSELGWQRTYIQHDTLTDTEDLFTPFNVKAKIVSDVDYMPETIRFKYFDITNNISSEASMTYDESTDEYSASIPAPGTETVFGYYITVNDVHRQNYYPGYPPEQIYTFYVGTDLKAPEVIHTAQESLSASAIVLPIACEVFDNIGIAKVEVQFKINETPKNPVTLFNDSLSHYSGVLSFNVGDFVINDTIYYQIVAIDVSSQSNSSVYPTADTYYKTSISEVLTEYANAFDDNKFDFTGADFKIIKPTGFDTPVLRCEYQTAGEGNFLNYIAQLKYPIILRSDSAWMQFDEVVLVEPGEEGSTYLDEDFYDYVIVEGSKDNGENWHPFEPGYDCQRYKIWKDAYNKSISAGDSKTLGKKEYFVRHSVNLYAKDNFFKGEDEVLIRFRLFSDAYSKGWGWAIDSLKIQKDIYSIVSGVSEAMENLPTLSVFPNPASNSFTINSFSAKQMSNAQIEIYSIEGKKVFAQSIKANGNAIRETIATDQFSNGLYVVKLRTNTSVVTSKLLIMR